jgi:hypothetical protein
MSHDPPEPERAANPDTDDAGRWLTPGVKGIGSASLLSDPGHGVDRQVA